MDEDTKQTAFWCTSLLAAVLILVVSGSRCSERQDALEKQTIENCIAKGKTYIPQEGKVFGVCA